MRSIVVLLLLASLAFAGCVETADPEVAQPGVAQVQERLEPEATDPVVTSDNNATDDEPEPEPVANLAPNMTFTASVVEGEAPLAVVFSVDAEDPEGDAMTWALNPDGTVNATQDNEVPGTYTFTYEEAGMFTATAFVSDGNNTVQQDVAITVTAPAPAPPAGWGGIDETILVGASCTQCSLSGAWTSLGLNAGVNGMDVAWVPLPADAIGKNFRVSSDFGDPDAQIATNCGASYAHVNSYGAGGAESGVVPAGSGCIFAWEFVGAVSSIRFQVFP